MERAPNLKLAQAMQAARFSNKSLARAVVDASHQRAKIVSTDHSRVSDWLDGRQPRQPALDALLLAFELRTGRPYSADDLGFVDLRPLPSDLGLSYERDLSTAVGVVADLARHDLNDHPGFRAGHYAVGGLSALCLDWLLGQDVDELPSRATQGVTSVHIDELRLMRENVDQLDRRFGGEQHRRMAVRYLRDTVAPRLRALRDDPTSHEYLHEAAILCELIGWMAYDTDQQTTAQRYFARAVRLAQAAGDEGYAAFAVTSMADQALFVGHPSDALRLATVAAHRTARGMPTVALLEARVFQARASAVLGDAATTTEALTAAGRLFEGMAESGVPSWGAHWTEAVLHSHAATAWIDLGDQAQARQALDELGRLTQDQPRRRLYYAVQSSRAGMLAHDVDLAVGKAVEAVDALAGVSSRRTWQQVETQVRALVMAGGRDPRTRLLRDRWREAKVG